MGKLLIGKIMFKPTTTKVIMEKLMIIKLIMAKPTQKKKGKISMTKLIWFN